MKNTLENTYSKAVEALKKAKDGLLTIDEAKELASTFWTSMYEIYSENSDQ